MAGDQTRIEMKVLTKDFATPWSILNLLSIERSLWPQIILVMIWVVLPPAGEEYCCIQKVLLKPYLQLVENRIPIEKCVLEIHIFLELDKPYLLLY